MTLSVAVTGNGYPVVLLHGWGVYGSVWDIVAAELARRFQVHVPHLPGYGGSPSCAPYRLETLTECFTREMPLCCHVVGWSLGALIALAWARHAPRQVVRLALLAATPCFVRQPAWPHGLERATLEEFARDLESDRPRAIARFMNLQVKGDDAAWRTGRTLRQIARQEQPDMAALRGGLQILLEMDLREALGEVRQRALVVHGNCDRVIPLAAGRALAAALPGARFVVLEGAGHAPFLSQPGRVATLLSDFLDG